MSGGGHGVSRLVLADEARLGRFIGSQIVPLTLLLLRPRLSLLVVWRLNLPDELGSRLNKNNSTSSHPVSEVDRAQYVD